LRRPALAPQLKRDPLGGALAITRYSPGRIFVVTLGLSAAGAVFGGVAGAVALAISLVLSGDYDHLNEPLLFAVAATLGAMLGAGCAPLAGWLLLRRVPLGRAFGGLTVGATVGGVVGWFLPRSFAHGDGILIAAALGFLGAAVVLRIRHARDASNLASRDDGAA